MFAQWIIDEQMTELASRLSQRGQTLELDIPIGVHPHGYDVWRNPEDYVSTVSIGAPPDDLTSQGQNWGSPRCTLTDAERTRTVSFARRCDSTCALRASYALTT